MYSQAVRKGNVSGIARNAKGGGETSTSTIDEPFYPKGTKKKKKNKRMIHVLAKQKGPQNSSISVGKAQGEYQSVASVLISSPGAPD